MARAGEIRVVVTAQMLEDAEASAWIWDGAYEEFREALAGRPRLGPPAPLPERVPALCPNCGYCLDDPDDGLPF